MRSWESDSLGFKIRCILDHKAVGPWLIYRKKRRQLCYGKPTRINIGGGNFLNGRWGNLDYASSGYPYKNGVIDFNFDLTSGQPFPFKDDSIDLFYSCHCIEHVPIEHFEHIFAEIFRCLKPGGGVRLSTPDYDILYDMYLSNRKNNPKNYREIQDKFLFEFASSLTGKIPVEEFCANFDRMSPGELADHYCAQASREIQKNSAGNHINWWNFEKLERMLSIAGLREICRSRPFESRFEEMNHRIRFFGLEKITSLQSMLGFDSKASEVSGKRDISIYVEAIK